MVTTNKATLGIPNFIYQQLCMDIVIMPGRKELRFSSDGYAVLMVHRKNKPSKKYYLDLSTGHSIKIGFRGMNIIETQKETIVPEEDRDE